MTPGASKALFVHSANELYGADVILLELLQGREPARWEPLVILPNDVPYEGRLSARLTKAGVPWLEMKTAVLRRRYFGPRLPQYLAYFAASAVALARLIRREQIDVVHSNTTAVIPGAIAARLTHTPHIWHCHEIIVSPAAIRKLTAFLAPALSETVIAVSGAVRDHMLQTNPRAGNIRVLHNGIDVERFAGASGSERVRAELGFAEGDVVAGTLARISRGKGQRYLVEALARISRECPDLKLLLVGDAFVGQESLVDELRSLIAASGLADRVVLAGYRTDGPDVLAAMDICVLPSTLPDSFPTVVLEGMAAGKPVIATGWGGAMEMVVEGETGFIVPTDDASVLAERLARLTGDEAARRRLGLAGQKRARELFTRQRMCDQFWALMQDAADTRSSR